MIAGGAVLCWVILMAATGSLTGATILLIVLAAFGVVAVFGLRALGVTRDHPWIQRAAARPWRDGQDVLQIALRHLSEVFVVTPSGTLLAPNIVDLRMNPEDLRVLGERMEPALVMASAAEVYQEQVAEHGARFARPGPAEVRMIVDPSVPPGRYRLRQGQPVTPASPPSPATRQPRPRPPIRPPRRPTRPRPSWPSPRSRRGPPPRPYPADRPTRTFPGTTAPRRPTRNRTGRPATGCRPSWNVPSPPSPCSGSSPVTIGETRTSGARAGRGPVELGLPEVPTVSREHARFTFSAGRWRVANLGMNGLTVNGEPVPGEHPVSDGDSIRWGTRPTPWPPGSRSAEPRDPA